MDNPHCKFCGSRYGLSQSRCRRCNHLLPLGVLRKTLLIGSVTALFVLVAATCASVFIN